MKATINELFQQKLFSRHQASEMLVNMTNGTFSSAQTAALLATFQVRGITVDELAGFRDALRDMCLRVNLSEFDTIDLCGTGGDGKDTFNISTLASFVTAAAGIKVSKHGNYGVSSVCGSSNILEYYGYRFSADTCKLKRELDQAGICFLHAPLFNIAMKNVADVRKQLGVRTIFNMLGPLVNPSFPKAQMVGVFSAELARIYAYLFQQEDKPFAVVYSLDGYDEVSLTSPFKFFSNKGEELIDPEDLHLPELDECDLAGGTTVEESAQLFLRIIKGEGSSVQNAVVSANAGIAISVKTPSKSMEECIGIAREVIESGKAYKSFETLMNLNR
ncbi:anthranilate phosphoribosyltransferase [Williamwhitmania taraxaci]|uniref:Anthranilate phosphoribosyltransferase n=1 Tax=Williamwhitmania taraxaci TaxID=1640674 RepID=A0A1G6LQL8_9BACT|nr:anthranilate phosphoribosyltransferase [Williamwhitmania taraxaci]SDC45035.1 anthranilate phosphoribosyltransferase [Williamwhitmania taraxaci]